MDRCLPTRIVGVVAGAMMLLAPHAAPAQTDSRAAAAPPALPAMNLEEIVPRPGLPRLTVSNALGAVAHQFPVRARAALLTRLSTRYAGGDPPLVYHAGGAVMSNVVIYTILWAPPMLQQGSATSMPASYQSLVQRLAADYPGHGIDNNNSQYFQTIGTTTTYIKNAGSAAGVYIDTSPYPPSGCSDRATPGNCLTDAQIQTEIRKVMGLQGWTGGLNHLFILYTSAGEGSCFDNTSTECAYTEYCGYHGFIATNSNVIYANIPYGSASACQNSGAPSPNNNPAADTAISIVSHEISEAVTDPLLNAWFTANLGYEIGDLCGYDYGPTNTWDGGKANQSWNGHFYLLQTEFDNHAYSFGGGCVQLGPAQAPPNSGG